MPIHNWVLIRIPIIDNSVQIRCQIPHDSPYDLVREPFRTQQVLSVGYYRFIWKHWVAQDLLEILHWARPDRHSVSQIQERSKSWVACPDTLHTKMGVALHKLSNVRASSMHAEDCLLPISNIDQSQYPNARFPIGTSARGSSKSNV